MSTQIRLLFTLLILSLAACQSPSGETEADMADTTVMEPVETMITVTPFPGATEFSDAAIKSWTYENGTFNFMLGEGDYELGVQTPDAPQRMCANSAKGQHIHLILNNEPYSAQYTAEFAYKVPNGEHHMLAFLSRSYHESIKTDAAHVAGVITVEDESVTDKQAIEGPMLFYSRPKGTYIGQADTEKLLLDFYPVNAELGEEYQVKVEIDGEEQAMLDTWQPYAIEGMEMGEHTVTLTLVDGAGEMVDAPHNPVSRTITLKADPIEEQ